MGSINRSLLNDPNLTQSLTFDLPLLLFVGCFSNNQPNSKQNHRYALTEEYRAEQPPTGLDALFDSYKSAIKDSMVAHNVPGLAIASPIGIRFSGKRGLAFVSGCLLSAEGDPLVEYKPGLFFHRTAGVALDFRDGPPTWASIELRKVENQ